MFHAYMHYVQRSASACKHFSSTLHVNTSRVMVRTDCVTIASVDGCNGNQKTVRLPIELWLLFIALAINHSINAEVRAKSLLKVDVVPSVLSRLVTSRWSRIGLSFYKYFPPPPPHNRVFLHKLQNHNNLFLTFDTPRAIFRARQQGFFLIPDHKAQQQGLLRFHLRRANPPRHDTTPPTSLQPPQLNHKSSSSNERRARCSFTNAVCSQVLGIQLDRSWPHVSLQPTP